MLGLGTMINVAAVLIGGLLGLYAKKFIKEDCQLTLRNVCGIAVIFIGIGGALEGMLTVTGDSVASGRAMLIIGSLAIGGLVGEIINIEGFLHRFGDWLKVKSGSSKDKKFVDAFVVTSLTVCVGAMAIIGSIEDALENDYSILITKSILDMIMVMVLTGLMGKGCIFSAIPVFLFQGTITLAASYVKPVMTEAALSNLSFIGSILIFCVGVNIVWDKDIRVANLLPALVIAVAAAFLPFNL